MVTIITTEPNDTIESIHDRMPVMFEPDKERRWLEEDDADALVVRVRVVLAGVPAEYEQPGTALGQALGVCSDLVVTHGLPTRI